MEGLDLQQFVESGAIGLAVLLIILISLILKWVFKLVGNHMNHSTDAMIGNTKALTSLKDSMDSNNKTNESIMRVVERVENKLDKD